MGKQPIGLSLRTNADCLRYKVSRVPTHAIIRGQKRCHIQPDTKGGGNKLKWLGKGGQHQEFNRKNGIINIVLVTSSSSSKTVSIIANFQPLYKN